MLNVSDVDTVSPIKGDSYKFSYFHLHLLFFVISLKVWRLIGVYNFPEFHLFVTNVQIPYAASSIFNQSITLHAFYHRNIKY